MKLDSYEAGAVAGAPTVPASPSVGNPTNGDPQLAIPATTPGEYWYYQLQQEIEHVLTDAGLTPDAANLTQLSQAIAALVQLGQTGAFPAGTRLVFQQSAAPLGWTKETTHHNKALRIVSGSVSAGGVTNFTTVFGSSKTTASHTLALAELPPHAHTFVSKDNDSFSSGNAGARGTNLIDNSQATSTVGGGGGHSHNLAMDVQYVDVIVATKD